MYQDSVLRHFLCAYTNPTILQQAFSTLLELELEQESRIVSQPFLNLCAHPLFIIHFKIIIIINYKMEDGRKNSRHLTDR